MNRQTIRQQRAGFGYNDTLLSRFSFSGIPLIWEKSKVVKETPDGEIVYWTIKDEYGARMTCFEESLVEKLCIGERYEVRGEIKIGKGGMFLNLKSAKPMNGNEYTGEERHNSSD